MNEKEQLDIDYTKMKKTSDDAALAMKEGVLDFMSPSACEPNCTQEQKERAWKRLESGKYRIGVDGSDYDLYGTGQEETPKMVQDVVVEYLDLDKPNCSSTGDWLVNAASKQAYKPVYNEYDPSQKKQHQTKICLDGGNEGDYKNLMEKEKNHPRKELSHPKFIANEVDYKVCKSYMDKWDKAKVEQFKPAPKPKPTLVGLLCIYINVGVLPDAKVQNHLEKIKKAIFKTVIDRLPDSWEAVLIPVREGSQTRIEQIRF